MQLVRFFMTLSVVLCIGCTSRYQIRGVEPVLPSATLDETVASRLRMADMQARSIEDYGAFKLGIVEFADDGTYNAAQFTSVTQMVDDATAQRGGIIVTFVHGWHHGPQVCDSNLACFRRVLQHVATSPEAGGRPVVGVYVGWRGESVSVPIVNIGTLWSRKAVAENIGRTGGKELLIRLHDTWVKRNDAGLETTMVTVGHSLGGAFLLSAVKGELTTDVADVYGRRSSLRIVSTEGARSDTATQKALRARFGDLIVLVNPAIESVVYDPLDRDLKDQRVADDAITRSSPPEKQLIYAADQMPILMVVASRADGYVRWVFPVGQWVAPWTNWQVFDRASASIGLGHFGPQVTHKLTYSGHRPEYDTSNCDCRLSSGDSVDISDDDLKLRTAEVQSFGKLSFALNPRRLEKRGWDVNSPYLVVEADAGVIRNHNDIFNPVFTTFLVKYIAAYAEIEHESAKPNAPEPVPPNSP